MVLAAVTVAVLATAAGACRSSRAAGPSHTRVAMVGDSLAVLGGTQFTDRLDQAGWKVTIDAFPGVTTLEQMPVLAKAAKANNDPMVVELGTNDARAIERGDNTADRERTEVNAALDLIGSRCVVWVNADSNPTRPGGSGGAVVDAILATQAQQRPNLHIADLHGMLAAHPEYLVSDEVHLTPDGYRALGDLIATELRNCR